MEGFKVKTNEKILYMSFLPQLCYVHKRSISSVFIIHSYRQVGPYIIINVVKPISEIFYLILFYK